ncbi:MAG: D-amino-acid transaminase [Hyphomicrobium sp.]
MVRIVYVNGSYLPYPKATIHAEDRGFQFADAVYEVCEVRNSNLVDLTRHLTRLHRSLKELQMVPPMSDAALRLVIGEVLRGNLVINGLVYLPVTRGAAPRDFVFPFKKVKPTLVVLARSLDPLKLKAKAEAGISVTSVPDVRWKRCDLKTVMLLPAVLAKEDAQKRGAQEAWFVDEKGFVTEGGSSNAWIVLKNGTVVTRHLDNHILGGVTRSTVLDVLMSLGLKLQERAFSLSEAHGAIEAFVTSASATVMPVVKLDGQQIGTGKPGSITCSLREKFHAKAEMTPF